MTALTALLLIAVPVTLSVIVLAALFLFLLELSTFTGCGLSSLTPLGIFFLLLALLAGLSVLRGLFIRLFIV
jgi:hypothetical protein